MEKNTAIRRQLVDTAMGKAEADLVIRKGTWVCVQSGEFIPETDVAIKNDRIAYVGEDASYTIGKKTQIIEAKGFYLVPGLLDGHMHVESGMLTVTEYVGAVLPHGTTSMFIDPHEMANIFGLKGIQLMSREAARQPAHVWVEVPACVPSSPALETTGSVLSLEEIEQAMKWENVIGLGEMMDYVGVAEGDEKLLSEMEITTQAGKAIGGHYASQDLGRMFHAYVSGGATDDHEGTRMEDAVERVRQGMRAMLRYSSAWHDVAAQLPAITHMGLDAHRFILCTDDIHAETIVNDGHMDRVLRHAIVEGLAPMTAIQMATINTAEYFGVSQVVGMIAPGCSADILLVKDLKDFRATTVLVKGQIVAQDGKLLLHLPDSRYPEWAKKSIHLKKLPCSNDFRLYTNINDAKVSCNVIGVIENQAPTRHLRMDFPVVSGEVQLLPGVAKIALIERHHKTGIIQLGFVDGFGIKGKCAVASTVAHDCHHMLVIGTSESEMVLAVETLAGVGGGEVVVNDGKIIGLIELPLGGLMSLEKADRVAQKIGSILEGFKACGCSINNPNMTLSLLALVVIPELRISDKGLVDARRLKTIPVIEGPSSEGQK